MFIIDLPFRFVFAFLRFTFFGLGGNSPSLIASVRRYTLAVVGSSVAARIRRDLLFVTSDPKWPFSDGYATAKLEATEERN